MQHHFYRETRMRVGHNFSTKRPKIVHRVAYLRLFKQPKIMVKSDDFFQKVADNLTIFDRISPIGLRAFRPSPKLKQLEE